jgi:hypothetical protein
MLAVASYGQPFRRRGFSHAGIIVSVLITLFAVTCIPHL